MNVQNKIAHYQRIFGVAPESYMESLGNEADMLSSEIIQKKTHLSTETLRGMGENSDISSAKIKLLTSKIECWGEKSLTALKHNNIDYFVGNPEQFDLLEVIVETDGSRPSFLISNGQVDLNSSPPGIWGQDLYPGSNLLKQAISCVGRINKYGAHVGTGFLIGENLIMTNRHVLQSLGTQHPSGTWQLDEELMIDFGHELNGQASITPRELKRVIFSGPHKIDENRIDHAKLDMVLIELERDVFSDLPIPLTFDMRNYWAEPETLIYTIGYPGNPKTGGLTNYGGSVLQNLFKTVYGYKRLSPGQVIKGSGQLYQGRICHDATTLGGSSGSLLVIPGRENIAVALHYGGNVNPPRENWAHVLSNALSVTNGHSPTTLREYLEAYNVSFIAN